MVTKLLTLGILFLTSSILAWREALVAKLVISGILSSISLILALHISFLRTSFFTTHLIYLYQQEQVLIYQHLIHLLSLFKFLKVFSIFLNLSISNLSTSDFKLAKSVFLAKSDASAPVSFFKSPFVAWLDKPNSTFTLAPKDFGFEK